MRKFEYYVKRERVSIFKIVAFAESDGAARKKIIDGGGRIVETKHTLVKQSFHPKVCFDEAEAVTEPEWI